MVTVDLVKFEDWEQRPSHRQHQTQCWSDRDLLARWNIPDSPPALTNPWWPYRHQHQRVSATVSHLPSLCRPQGKKKETCEASNQEQWRNEAVPDTGQEVTLANPCLHCRRECLNII